MEKIKILQYVSCMNRAGAETLLMNIYRNINRDKFEFHFISHTKEKCDYDDEIEALGGKVIYLERPSLKNLNKYKKDFNEVVKKNGPYRAIHAHMQLNNGLILKVAKDIGIKTRISHAHLNGDYSKNSFSRNCYRKYSKYLIRSNTTVNVSCSNESGKYLYDGREFKLLKNAIDLNNFNLGNKHNRYLNEELNLKNDIKIITHIGRFVQAKNHKFIIDIFSKVIEKNNNYRLILCGEGPLKEKIQELVKTKELSDYVYFLGVRDDINKILLGTDIYLMPSILEGLPVVLVEAQAAGVNCIISDNIPKECDMEMGLINYMSLNDNSNKWVNTILQLDFKFIGFKERERFIIKKGYSLEENIIFLDDLYSN